MTVSSLSVHVSDVFPESVSQLQTDPLDPVGRQNNGSPKDAHVLISKTSDYVTLHGKKGFTGVIKMKILK